MIFTTCGRMSTTRKIRLFRCTHHMPGVWLHVTTIDHLVSCYLIPASLLVWLCVMWLMRVSFYIVIVWHWSSLSKQGYISLVPACAWKQSGVEFLRPISRTKEIVRLLTSTSHAPHHSKFFEPLHGCMSIPFLSRFGTKCDIKWDIIIWVSYSTINFLLYCPYIYMYMWNTLTLTLCIHEH